MGKTLQFDDQILAGGYLSKLLFSIQGCSGGQTISLYCIGHFWRKNKQKQTETDRNVQQHKAKCSNIRQEQTATIINIKLQTASERNIQKQTEAATSSKIKHETATDSNTQQQNVTNSNNRQRISTYGIISNKNQHTAI